MEFTVKGGGVVELYHNNLKKFETTTTGATVTGTLVSGSVTSELDLTAISSSISDTAVDVFVYDTRKDSDGGAWRKRTQHTSWYNETLNTSTRGSRKEFPAVAVIVVNQSYVSIYDGDDPDLPLWMRFNQSTTGLGAMVGYTSFSIGSAVMLNGMLMVGMSASNQGNVAGLRLINFISEQFSWKAQNSSRNSSQHWPIEDRNGGRSVGYNDGNYIVSEVINDVAATVLPNAPIDDTTGLPIPTIAVATPDGLSIIKHDGTVIDGTSASGNIYSYVKVLTITEENYLWFLADYFNGYNNLRDSFALSLDALPSGNFTWNNSTDNLSAGRFYALTTGNESGEIQIGSVNTWAWNRQERNALSGPLGLAIHKPNIGSETNSLFALITSDYNSGWMHGSCRSAFLADTDTTNKTNGQTDPDRSEYNNALTVTGTITKSAVATGADLVAYSGFTGSNYMTYSASNMNFGTGDFSVSVWCIPSTDQSNEFILELDNASSGSNRFYFLTTNTATKRLYLPWDTDIAGSELTPGEWNHIVVGRKSGYGFVYVNNRWISDGNKPWTVDLQGNGNGTISNYSGGVTNDYAWSGSLALLRISGSAPSAEQVSKMYEDEKVLFQENAKCTLYGSSNAVTGLAYDDSTELYHVGTSAGRSDFQGLRRINNTTTAVTTAISASDELIAEQ